MQSEVMSIPTEQESKDAVNLEKLNSETNLESAEKT